MESTALIAALLSTQTPLLPAPLLARGYLALAWGLVLAALAIGGLRHRRVQDARWRLGLPAALLFWCLLPGAASPAYWLGLAFRAPSGLLALLCAWVVLGHYRPAALPLLPLEALRRWSVALVLPGWLLLLDTFAVWPWSVYDIGFAPVTLAVLLLLGLLPWLLRAHAGVSALLAAALLLHLLLRLPSGNVWDALLDPCLWLLLQADWLRRKLTRSKNA